MPGKVHVSRPRALRVSLVTLAALISTAGMLSGTGTDSFADVMRRVHAYVTVYEDHELSTVIAHERYHQQWLDGGANLKRERTLLSDYVLLQLADEDWVAVRDVYEVDGEVVADRGARLKTLFSESREQWRDRAMKMAKDSARFNLGEFYRTVNLPTFSLRVLRPANRKRIAFDKAGEEQVDDTRTWVIAFRETEGPTFSATPAGTDIPAQGRVWVEPDTGAVLRLEMILGGTRDLSERATITVTYRLEPSLGFRVPIEMRERYDNPRRKRDDVVIADATYSDFRRFDWRTLGLPGANLAEPSGDRVSVGEGSASAFTTVKQLQPMACLSQRAKSGCVDGLGINLSLAVPIQ